MKRLLSSFSMLALGASTLLLALPLAAWELAPEHSRVSATVMQITPDGPVPRQHEVRRLSGSADASGTLQLPLRLNQSDVVERLGPLPPWLSGLTERPMATLTTQFPPERLERLTVGDSLVETLTMRVQSGNVVREESLPVRFTKTGSGQVQVTNAERVSLDGQALMADASLRTVMLLLGYEQIGDDVPVSLDAVLIKR
ncbi:YceI family protein [Halomonas sp. E19]|uniref:YceI family protein n=1 Tax=Halomonas sp. E19 TaxID=3397247 RepID=UPI004033956D